MDHPHCSKRSSIVLSDVDSKEDELIPLPDEDPPNNAEGAPNTINSLGKRAMNGSSSTEGTPPSKKVKKFIKTEDDMIPLQDPFPLPKHYRSDVETALANRKMTKETMSSFLSSIAAAMLVYKKYPSKDDYATVGRTVIQQYPFMSSPSGTPHVSKKKSP